jgi:crotonobetainyl-CoA:carnitine CoA-transferase CaiB-like acyl-CoA transferase
MPAPLAHVRAVELTDIRGALLGRILADLGAEVIKIEPPEGEDGRARPPFVGDSPGPERSLAFLHRNASKRSVTLALGDERDRARLDALLAGADLFLENVGPREHARLGLTPAALSARHPRLIVVSVSDFGLSGPRAHWRAEPLVAFAMSGAHYASGFLDKPPCWLPGYAAHDCGAIFAAAGAVAALLYRNRGGRAQAIEVSVQEAAINGLNPWAIILDAYSRLYPLVPSAPPRNADGAYLVLPVADGYLRFLAGTPRHWNCFLEVLGRPEALAGEEWENAIYRLLNADVPHIVGADCLRHRTRADVIAQARTLYLPVAPVNTPEEFVREEQTRARGFFREIEIAGRRAPLAPSPLLFSRTPAVDPVPGPALGSGGAGWTTARREIEATRAAGPAPSRLVLDGLRVINLGVGAVVPEMCWLLAELGAEVIKIESNANLDFLRAVSIEPGQPNRSWIFNAECRGQKSVVLNLKTPEARELARRLCATADVVAENNRGGVVAEWGLDYADIRALKPDVIYVASQGYGRGGPLGTAQAFGPLNSSFAGANYLWNHADAPYPAGSALNHPDHIASKLCAVAVLAALEHRRRTGEGQFIDMAQTEAAAYMLGEFYLQEPLTGRPASPDGNRAPYAAPHDVYPCRDARGGMDPGATAMGDDRWVAIAVVGDDAWRRFAAAIGQPDLAGDRRFATLESRLANRAALDALVVRWTSSRSAEEAAETLQAAGVSAGMVQSGDDHRGDPHLAARGAILTVDHPEVPGEHHSANPLRFTRTPVRHGGASPCLGADTDAVLHDILGIDPAQIAKWKAEKILW